MTSQEWRSYDSAAATHDQLAVPSVFTAPAKDLLARMDIRAAWAILGVGTGSGVEARLAAEAADPKPWWWLLTRPSKYSASRGRVVSVVGGGLPELPFSAAQFDRVLASFVLSHVKSYHSALLEIGRVLAPGGKLGVTTWGDAANHLDAVHLRHFVVCDSQIETLLAKLVKRVLTRGGSYDAVPQFF